MRFFLVIAFVLGLSVSASGQEHLEKPDFEQELFAAQLGEVSALAIAADGTVFAADTSRGRIFKLIDRGKDGQLDSRQLVAEGLTRPAGLAVLGERLFVSDARAVWEVLPQQGGLRRVASLENSQSAVSPRPIVASAVTQALMIGLTSKNGSTGQIISVDPDSGEAALIAEGSGPVDALALTGRGDLWIGSGSRILTVSGREYNSKNGSSLAPGSQVSGLILPDQQRGETAIAKAYPDHIFAAMQQRVRGAGFKVQMITNLYALPTQFGRPIDEAGIPIIEGAPARRSGNKNYGGAAIVLDERGIFVAYSGSGTIWRIVKSKPPQVRKNPEVIKLDQPKLDIPKAELSPKGSGITAGSTLTQGTTLEVGSTIPEDEEVTENEPDEETPAKSSKPQVPPSDEA